MNKYRHSYFHELSLQVIHLNSASFVLQLYSLETLLFSRFFLCKNQRMPPPSDLQFWLAKEPKRIMALKCSI